MALVRGDDAEWERPEKSDEYEWIAESIGTPTLVVMATMCSGIAAPEHAAIKNGLPTRGIEIAEIGSPPAGFLSQKFRWSRNAGDMTREHFAADFLKAAGGRIDLLVGGPPCQAFSSAGKGLGHDDPRGKLLSLFAAHAREMKCAVTILENVDRLRSTKDNSFGKFLQAALGSAAEPIMPPGKSRTWPHCGIATSEDTEIAWRMLDARYFGLAQRRVRLYAAITRRESGISATDIVFDSPPSRRPFRAIDFAPGCTIWLPRGSGSSVWDGCGPSPPGFDSVATPHVGDFLDPASDNNPDLTPTIEAVRGLAVRAFRAAKKNKKKPMSWPLAAALSDKLDGLPDDAEDVEGRTAVKWLAARRTEVPEAEQPSGVAVYTVDGGDGRIAPTFTTRSLDSPMRNTPFIVTVDPSKPTRRLLRMLSPAECLRLQGFDADWLDASDLTLAEQYVAIGNSMAVPCVGLLVGRAARAILRARKAAWGARWDEWIEDGPDPDGLDEEADE